MPRKFKTQRERVHVAPGEPLSTTSEGVRLVRESPYTWQTEKGERLIAWNAGRWTAARVLTTESVMAESVLETVNRVYPIGQPGAADRTLDWPAC